MSTHIKLRNIVFFTAICLALFVLFSFYSLTALANENFGGTTYGECPYGTACPATPATAPSPSPTNSSRYPDSNSTPDSHSESSKSGGVIVAVNEFLSILERSAFGRFVSKQPATIPVIFFILLLVMALILMVQAGIEHRNTIRLRNELNRFSKLQADISNFLQMVQHYLRTPIATMEMSLELMQSQKQAGASVALELVRFFNKDINPMIENAISELKKSPSASVAMSRIRLVPTQALKSKTFWFPVSVAVVLVFLYYILSWRIVSFAIATQLVIMELSALFALIVMLFLGVGFYHRGKQRWVVLGQISADTQHLEQQRVKTVEMLSTKLKQQYDLVNGAVIKLPETHEKVMVMAGASNIGRILDKFTIVKQLQDPNALTESTVQSYDLVDEIGRIVERVESASEPKRSIKLDTQGLSVRNMMGYAGLVDFVLASTIDNAVRYSSEAQPVLISLKTKGDHNHITITNSSTKITTEELNKAFKPFTSIGVSSQNEPSGPGISLYVAQAIMKRLNGSIVLRAEKSERVVCEINLPVRLDASAKKT